MKLFKMMLVAGVSVAVLSGCGANDNNTNNSGTNSGTNSAATAAPTTEPIDAVTTASIVNQPDAFTKAVSKDGNWIIAVLEDVTIAQDVVVEGEFHDKGAADGDIYRKIALYAQDADHNVTANYTLTVPKLTVQSENLRVQGGTIKGDVYVEANGFNLHETSTIEGNLYFASEEVQATAGIEGTVTGATEVQ